MVDCCLFLKLDGDGGGGVGGSSRPLPFSAVTVRTKGCPKGLVPEPEVEPRSAKFPKCSSSRLGKTLVSRAQYRLWSATYCRTIASLVHVNKLLIDSWKFTKEKKWKSKLENILRTIFAFQEKEIWFRNVPRIKPKLKTHMSGSNCREQSFFSSCYCLISFFYYDNTGYNIKWLFKSVKIKGISGWRRRM